MTVWLLAAILASGGRSDAQIHWSPPGAIVVNVVSRDLSPVPGATVTVHRADGPAGDPGKALPTGPGGHVEFRGLAGASYFVTVSLSGYLEMRFGPMPVEDKNPPTVRIPEILCVLNPVLSFEPQQKPEGR
jgi:hypothetical protein